MRIYFMNMQGGYIFCDVFPNIYCLMFLCSFGLIIAIRVFKEIFANQKKQVPIQKPNFKQIRSIFKFIFFPSLSFKFQSLIRIQNDIQRIPVYKVESNLRIQHSLNFGLYKCYMSHRIHNVNLNL